MASGNGIGLAMPIERLVIWRRSGLGGSDVTDCHWRLPRRSILHRSRQNPLNRLSQIRRPTNRRQDRCLEIQRTHDGIVLCRAGQTEVTARWQWQ